LIETVDGLLDGETRELFQDCLQSLLALYGEGLEHIVRLTKNAGPAGEGILMSLAQDKLVRSLLLIHNLHPQTLELRLDEALARVRPYLQSHGGNVELISLEQDHARLRLQGTCESCPSSSVTLELAVRQAIEEACPDLLGFEVEGGAPTPADGHAGNGIPHGPNAPHWTVLENFVPPADGGVRALELEGAALLLCHAAGNLYAYGNRCAICAAALDTGTLDGALLRCPAGHAFDVRRAGVCPDHPEIHLDPFPLLAVNGTVKIAVAGQAGTRQLKTELTTDEHR
jgi:Fe-S cluster biogenesis protein NfuA/nitrite reductase/ring-hydroxylating ferredoxin subunit